MSFEKKESKGFAQRWDAWRQSSKSAAFFAFLTILCLIFAFAGGLVLILCHFSGDPEKWGSVLFMVMALIVLLSPRWR